MRFHRLALALVGLALVSALVVESRHAVSQTRSTGTKWALLVGVDEYESDDITPLRFAVKDVKDVAGALVDYWGFPRTNVLVMTSDVRTGLNRPTNVNVMRRLDYLAQRVAPGDTFLFYFSGHGFQRENGRHFLGTVNADLGSIETLQLSALPIELLREKMSKVRAHKIVFMIDACRNDPDAGKSDKDNPLSDTFARDLAVVAKAGGSGQAGTAMFFACSKGERSYEWPERQNGAFTYFLLEGLKGKAANARGELTMTGLGKYVIKEVEDWSLQHAKRQRPFLAQEGTLAEIVLADRLKPVDTTTEVVVTGLDTAGQLVVTSNPAGAKVYVDGKATGKTTPATIEVELGVLRTKKVEVGFQLAGHKDSVFEVELQRGKRLSPELIALTKVVVKQDEEPMGRRINPVDGAEIVWIPAGTFQMGDNNDGGTQQVRGFWMYTKEVTNGQYRRFVQANSQWGPGKVKFSTSTADSNYLSHWTRPTNRASSESEYPVVCVSWYAAKAYAEWAGRSAGSVQSGRLPTEAEWEYAARGGRQLKYPTSSGQINKGLANYGDPSGSTKPGGQYPANPFGLYDMAGNLYEWCSSLYRAYPYSSTDGRESIGLYDSNRVLRGGSYSGQDHECLCASRVANWPPDNFLAYLCDERIGFRVVVSSGGS